MKVKLNSNMITGVLFLIVSVALHILIPSQIRTQWRGITLHHSAVIRHLAPVIRTVEHRGFLHEYEGNL